MEHAIDFVDTLPIFGLDPDNRDMASFRSVLQVGGKQYEILYSDFILHQYVDSLGRPASRTHGGAFLLEIEPPPKGDGLLTGWMFDPAMELNAQVVLWDGEGKMLRVIKLYNAYCVSLEGQFNATGLGLNRRSSLRDTLYISPQAVDINGLFHDNDWPGPSPIVDWDWTTMNEQCNPAAKARQEQAPAAVPGGGPGPKKKPKPRKGFQQPTFKLPPDYKRVPRRVPPMEPAPPRVSLPRLVPLLTGVVVFIAGVLLSHDAGVSNEWERKLPDDDEQRYNELLAKRNRLKAEGDELSDKEFQELLELTEKKYPNKDHRPMGYDPADYHGKTGNATKSKDVENGEELLKDSILVKAKRNGSQRIAITEDGEFAVFDETRTTGEFHGHVRTYEQLSPDQKRTLIKAGFVNPKTGKIIKRKK